LAGRLGWQTWPTDLAGRLDWQTWPADLVGSLGRQTCLSLKNKIEKLKANIVSCKNRLKTRVALFELLDF
jgi:hypothetical protein